MPSDTIFSDKKISELGLPEWLVENCKSLGIIQATDIQARAIPEILKGNDIIARAKTGSGKTAAFALPILHHLSQDPYGIFALVLTPTRELACQIGDQIQAFSVNTGFKCAIVYGGSGFITNTGQVEDRPHIVIATPGRLADLINGGMEFPVEELKYVVIDEADQLLGHKSFIKSLQIIFERLPPMKSRQTLLFSATLDRSMKHFYDQILSASQNTNDTNNDNNNNNNNNDDTKEQISTKKIPIFIETSNFTLETAMNTVQYYAFMPEMSKETYLVTILKSSKYEKKSIIVFISSREYCQIMAALLRKFGLPISELHGNMKQRTRLENLYNFRSGHNRILVCSDVASRGLDIPQVEVVINFDIPRTPLEYVHRIGRCGRVDRHGVSITFMSQYDISLLQEIEKHVGVTMRKFPLHYYEAECIQLMETVLIKRASVISKFESKYLEDPEELRKHPMLRWKGKFTDPRITDGNDLKKIEKQNTQTKSNFKQNIEKDLDYLIEMNKMDQMDTEQKENEDTWAKEYEMKLEKERLRHEEEEQHLQDIMNRYTLKKKKKKKKPLDIDIKKNNEKNKTIEKIESNDITDNVLIDFRDTEARELQEKTNNNNNDTMDNEIENMNEEVVDKDSHRMFGWQSFRYGKNKHLYKTMGRTARAISKNKETQIRQHLRTKKLKKNEQNQQAMDSNGGISNINNKNNELSKDILSWDAPRFKTKQPLRLIKKNTKFKNKPMKKIKKSIKKPKIQKKKPKIQVKPVKAPLPKKVKKIPPIPIRVKLGRALKQKLGTTEVEKLQKKKEEWFGNQQSIQWE